MDTSTTSTQGYLKRELEGELWSWFIKARSARFIQGATSQLRRGSIQTQTEHPELPIELPEGLGVPDSNCGCDPENSNQSCSECEPMLDDVCADAFSGECEKQGVFDSIAQLLTQVKLHDFTAGVVDVYSRVGNRPHSLKNKNDTQLLDKELNASAQAFYAQLQSFLDDNEVKIDEIDTLFDFDSLAEIRDRLIGVVQQDANDKADALLGKYSDALENVFADTNFIDEYIAAVSDTRHYPLGVLWCDGHSLIKNRVIKAGKLRAKFNVVSTAKRIDPRYFWATDDWTKSKSGTMCFRLVRVSTGDVVRMKSDQTVAVQENITEFLSINTDGSRLYAAGLFTDDYAFSSTGTHDVLIARGMFCRQSLEQYGVSIPAEMGDESHIRAEVHYAGAMVLRILIIPYVMDDYGVYTTVFRENGESIWGLSLISFVWPFAKMYEGIIKHIDESVENSVGAIVSLDVGVLTNPEQIMVTNEKTGQVEVDLHGTTIITFDSTNALGSPNFKGIPIHVTNLPSDLDSLIPTLGVVFQQLEVLTGVVSAGGGVQPSASAIRSADMVNLVYERASRPMKAILRYSESNMLRPAIQFFLDMLMIRSSGIGLSIDLHPIILLSAELTREANQDAAAWGDVERLATGDVRGVIPNQTIADQYNVLGRKLGYTKDIVPSGLSQQQQAPQGEPNGSQ